MLQLIASWVLILPTLFILGSAFEYSFVKRMSNKKSDYELDLALVIGIAIVTWYAQAFSLFHGVGLNANIMLVIIDLAVLIVCRKTIRQYVIETLEHLRNRKHWQWIIPIVILFAFCIADASAGENVCFDTNLYHAQAIRWIEECGVAPGQGIFMRRLAYNSAFFSLQALYSFKFLFGQSLRNINGLVAFIFLTYDILSFRAIWKKKYSFSDAFRVVSMLIVYDVSDYKSSSTDMFTMLLGVYILTKWCTYLEEEEKNIHKYANLCMLAVFATTVKLSAVGLLILSLYPVIKLVREKKYKTICFYVMLGGMIALPYFIRNYYVSGWLIYPVSKIDIFSPDWKMHKETLDYDSAEISVWAKELALREDAFEIKGMKWFPYWWETKTFLQKLITVVDITMVPLGVLVVAINKKVKRIKGAMSLVLAVNAVFLTWFLKAPLIRYGNGWFYLNAAMLVAGVLYWVRKYIPNQIKQPLILQGAACIIVML